MRGIRIEAELDPVRVYGVDDYMKMLVDNLLSNAISYSYNDSVVKVTCHLEDDQHVRVTLRDHGIGIAPDKLPKIFQDYFRTSEATQHNRASSGLGLAIVRLVANALRISVQVASAPGWGTRFCLSIPAICESSPN